MKSGITTVMIEKRGDLRDNNFHCHWRIISDFFIIPIILFIWIWMRDEKQEEHSVLRNYPVIGKLRFIFEKIGPELRQYLFLNDREELPFSRREYEQAVMSGKYKSRTMGFGSKRDFDKPGYYIRNVLFPKQRDELRIDQSEKSKQKCIRSIKTIY